MHTIVYPGGLLLFPMIHVRVRSRNNHVHTMRSASHAMSVMRHSKKVEDRTIRQSLLKGLEDLAMLRFVSYILRVYILTENFVPCVYSVRTT